MQLIRTITNEPLYHEILGNGLPVYILQKPGFQKKYAVFATRYGSLDSEFEVAGRGIVKVPDGIAHFLEHKLFEEEEGHVFQRFAQFGASVNAYTSYNLTAYLFSTIEYFPEALTELLRFVQNPYLTAENVDKERGIIEQELRMYDDNPSRKIYRNLLNALYHKHPIRIDVGGTGESIQDISVDLLLECYHLFYQPANMALVVIGDFDPHQIMDLIKAQMESWNYQAQEIKRIFPDEPDTVCKPWFEQRMNISQPRYYLGLKGTVRHSGRELLKQQFAVNMIWHSLAAKSSPVFERLYNSGLINDSFGASFQAAPRYAFSVIGGETEDPDKLDAAIREAITELKRKQISSDLVERLKRQSLGSYFAAHNSLDYLANSFIVHLFNGTSFLDVPKVIESLTADEVNQFLQEELDLERSAVSVLLPE